MSADVARPIEDALADLCWSSRVRIDGWCAHWFARHADPFQAAWDACDRAEALHAFHCWRGCGRYGKSRGRCAVEEVLRTVRLPPETEIHHALKPVLGGNVAIVEIRRPDAPLVFCRREFINTHVVAWPGGAWVPLVEQATDITLNDERVAAIRARIPVAPVHDRLARKVELWRKRVSAASRTSAAKPAENES